MHLSVRAVAPRDLFGRTLILLLGVVIMVSTLSSVPAAAATASQPAPTGVEAGLGPIVQTANLANFQAGNIMTDAVFFDRGTMSPGQIQSFLESKVPVCRSGFTCLKDWYDTSRATAADAMCGAYPGGYRERASDIIYKVAQACGINPQVLLATLQKEQGLVLHTWPSEWRYTIAMGQGCPDTAACDTRYYGFFNQVYGAAWQFKRYANPPGTSQYFTWYRPGNTWNVRWHPNVACGSSPVYIQNQATANLYYYTPYQPNAAALQAGYGLGDGCSSYGNRNFYQYFTDWFGSAQGETMQVLQVAGTSERYLVSQGSRWRLATPEMAAQYTWISVVRDVSRSDIESYRDRGSAPRAVRTETGTVYLLDSGARHRLRDVAQVADFGWDYGALPQAGDGQVARYRDGGWLERVVRNGGFTWLIQTATRREIVDLSLLPRYGIPALSTDISTAMAAEYQTSSPVVGPGVYRDATNPYRVLTDAGVYGVPDSASGTAIARSARELTPDSFAYLRSSTTLPLRMTSGGRSYVLVEDGWLGVSAPEYPASLPFTDLPNGAASGIASAGTAAGPHFLRERSDTQVYLVSGGLQAVSSSDQAWITRTYGVNPRVWVALDGTIADATTPEGLVRTSAGAPYLLDGPRAYRMRDCEQVTAWGGNCASLPTVTSDGLRGYADAGTLRDLVRTPSGTTWLPQGGQLRQVLDPSILALYGISATTSAVSAATLVELPIGEPVLASGVYSDGRDARAVVTAAGEYTLTREQNVGVARTSARALVAESFAKISIDGQLPSRMTSDGRAFVLTLEGWLEVSPATYGGIGVFTALPSGAWNGIAVAANEQRPHFVRDNATSGEYLVSAGAAQPVSGAGERASITSAYGVPAKVWVLVGGALTGVRVDYELMTKSAAGEVFLMDGNTRYLTGGCSTAADFGLDCAGLRVLTSAQLEQTRDGGALAPLLRSPDGFVWLVQSGAKREVPDTRVLAAYGVGGASTPVSANVLAQVQLGQPVLGVGVYDDRSGDVRVVTGDGRAFAVLPASRIGSVAAGALTISPASQDLISVGGDLPTRVTAGQGAFVLTNEGWLAVNPADYAPLAFAAIGPRGTEGIPSAGSESRPHFVREYSSTQVLLASAGLTGVGDESARRWISSTYGVPAKVWVVPNGTLS